MAAATPRAADGGGESQVSPAWPSGAQSPEGASETQVRQVRLLEPGLGEHEPWALVPKDQMGLQGRQGTKGRMPPTP